GAVAAEVGPGEGGRLALGLELVAEAADAPADGPRGGVGEGADRPALHLVADLLEEVEVAGVALALVEAREELVEPAGAVAAGRALPARLVPVEVGDAAGPRHHVRVLVEEADAGGADGGAGLAEGLGVHRDPVAVLPPKRRRGGAAGDDGLQPLPAARAAGHLQEVRDQHAR